MTLAFQVYGIAQPKGSTKAFVPKGWTRPIITESNKNVRSWSQLVAEGASRALLAQPDDTRGVLQEGVRLTVAFYLPRPKALMRRGVNPSHLKKPDLDKLVRAVKDALTRVLWHDDSQVIELVARKDYAGVDDAPHVDVRVEPAHALKPVIVPAPDKGPVLFPLDPDKDLEAL